MERWIVGVDEVGRGPIAGPVTVCAVALPESLYRRTKWHTGTVTLTDSKQMTAAAREKWFAELRRHARAGVARYAIASRSAAYIDKRGISAALHACVKDALARLRLDPNTSTVLLDGGLFAPSRYITQQTVIRGDTLHKIISLASVAAKVSRDRYMTRMHALYPDFSWDKNKGYGTREHIKALKRKGISPLHRRTFLTRILDKNSK